MLPSTVAKEVLVADCHGNVAGSRRQPLIQMVNVSATVA
jgi:hypothetical protein